MGLTWGQVFINGILAATLFIMFVNYNSLFYGLLLGTTNATQTLIAKTVKLPLLPQTVVASAIMIAAVLYAVAIDDTPIRVIKGVVMGLIGVTAGQEIANVLGMYIGHYIYELVTFLTNPLDVLGPMLGALAGGVLISFTLVATTVEGAVALGFVFGNLPGVISFVTYIYSVLIANPLRTALLKLLSVFTKRTHLGFLMPIGIYAVSVLMFFVFLPVAFILLYWLLGMLLGTFIALAVLGPAEFAIQVIGFLVGLAVTSILQGWVSRIYREIPSDVVLMTSPAIAIILLAIAAVPIAAALYYSLLILPAAAIVVSVALIASPTVRGAVDKYVPMFVALFLLQLMGFLFATLTTAAQNPQSFIASMTYCSGPYTNVSLLFKGALAPLAILNRTVQCAVNVTQYFDASTGCFNFTTMPNKTTQALNRLGYPTQGGPVLHEVPATWWIPPQYWYNPNMWYDPWLWNAAAAKGALTWCENKTAFFGLWQYTQCAPNPWDAICNPYKKAYPVTR
ncbi:MAG: hypothetical protein RXO32_10735 [Thermoproteus sp.]